jgi:hypothetical protein
MYPSDYIAFCSFKNLKIALKNKINANLLKLNTYLWDQLAIYTVYYLVH